jgi:hypothetical protein
MRMNRFGTAVAIACLWSLCCFVSPAAAQTFSNTGIITINDNQAANPYPSVITISGLDPTLTYQLSSVLLRNVSHTFTSDIDVLLVGPSGAQTLLMSDNFGDLILNDVNLQFSDATTLTMGSSGDLSAQEMDAFEGSVFDVNGFGQPRANGGTARFRPSNFGIGDIFSAPAPVGPYTNIPLSTYTATGASLNGQSFRLFVQDDGLLDSGLIAGGWEMTFLSVSVTVPEPRTAFLLICGICFGATGIRKNPSV